MKEEEEEIDEKYSYFFFSFSYTRIHATTRGGVPLQLQTKGSGVKSSVGPNNNFAHVINGDRVMGWKRWRVPENITSYIYTG